MVWKTVPSSGSSITETALAELGSAPRLDIGGCVRGSETRSTAGACKWLNIVNFSKRANFLYWTRFPLLGFFLHPSSGFIRHLSPSLQLISDDWYFSTYDAANPTGGWVLALGTHMMRKLEHSWLHAVKIVTALCPMSRCQTVLEPVMMHVSEPLQRFLHSAQITNAAWQWMQFKTTIHRAGLSQLAALNPVVYC